MTTLKRHFLSLLTAFVLLTTMAVNAQVNDSYKTFEDEFYEELEEKGYDIVIIENDKVRQFMDDRTYSKPDKLKRYDFSIVKKYSTGGSSKPAGIQINWTSDTPAEDISSVVVSLVELHRESDETLFDGDLNWTDVKRYYPEVNSTSYLLCNMCPERYCYYQVEEFLKDGKRHLLKRGRFYTDGQVRMLRVGGMYNVRDFGGWDTEFGEIVAYGRIFRGNRPDPITEVGKNDFVKNEHITADLDLRGTSLGQSPMGPITEVEYYCTNNQRYKLALTGTGGPLAIARDLEVIADVLRRGGSVFLHCNHGVNRAGSLSVVIDGLLGLNEADINRAYELSSFAYGSVCRGKSLGEMFSIIRTYGRPVDSLAQCFYNFARSKGVTQDALDTIRCQMLGLEANNPLITQAHSAYNAYLEYKGL